MDGAVRLDCVAPRSDTMRGRCCPGHGRLHEKDGRQTTNGRSSAARPGRARKEALHMSHNGSRRLAVTALVLGVIVSACGSSSATPLTVPTAATAVPATAATPAPTTAPIATATIAAAAAAASCPTAATVGSALGITLPYPTTVAGGGGTSLPAGATGVACEYAGIGMNVIIELITNISPTYIDQFSGKFPVTYKSVSGVGDQAR